MVICYYLKRATCRYRLKERRLETFANKWPYPDDSSCSKEAMAHSGFYYMDLGDCVHCYMCDIEIRDWNPEKDNPDEIHKLAEPCCYVPLLAPEDRQEIEELNDSKLRALAERYGHKGDPL